MSDTPSFLMRTELLLGAEKLEKLRKSHVLVLGVGGVGAYTAEMLVRAGVGELTIVDGDVVEETNLNRQLVALHSTFGRPKTKVLKERFLDINPECIIHDIFEYIENEKTEKLLETHFDYAVDAIDSLSPKVYFLKRCLELDIPVISSMGSGGRLDPLAIQVADISKTYNCGLARAVRQKLKKLGISKGIKTVFSTEEVPSYAVKAYTDENGYNHSMTGTVSYLVAVFGCVLAAEVIKNLSNKN